MLNIYLDKGIRLFKKGEYYDAIDELNKAVDSILKINKNLAYRYIAASYLELGKFNEAVANINKSVSLYKGDYYSDYDDPFSLFSRLKDLCIEKKYLTDNIVNCFKNAGELGILGKIYYSRASDYYKAGKNDLAISELKDETIKSMYCTNKPLAYKLRGDAYYNKKEYDKAFADYLKEIEFTDNSKKALACKRLGDLYYEIKEYDKAFAAYVKEIEFTSDSKDLAYERLGDLYNKIKEYDKAIAAYTEQIKLASGSSEHFAYNRRGNAYYNKKEYGKAIADYLKAIELDPKEPIYYSNIGNAYYFNGDYINAIANYDKASKLDKNKPLPNLKNACDKLEATNPKFSEWAEYIKKNPNEAKGYAELAKQYADAKLHEQAIENYNKAIKLEPDNAIWYVGLGDTYSDAGLHEQALENYNKAIELEPDYAYAYIQRGYNYYFKQAYYNDAIVDLNHAIKLDPDISYAHICLGDVYNVFASTFCSDTAYLPTAREKFILSYHHYKRADEIDRPKGYQMEALDDGLNRVIKNINETVQIEIRPYREKITNLQDELHQANRTISSLRNTIASQSQTIANLQNSNSYYREQASRTPRTIVKREVVYSPVGPNYCGP